MVRKPRVSDVIGGLEAVRLVVREALIVWSALMSTTLLVVFMSEHSEEPVEPIVNQFFEALGWIIIGYAVLAVVLALVRVERRRGWVRSRMGSSP